MALRDEQIARAIASVTEANKKAELEDRVAALEKALGISPSNDDEKAS